MTISQATLADAAQLETLINSAYRGEESKKGWTTEAELLQGKRVTTEGIEKNIGEPGAVILKYCNEENELLGCVYLKKNNNNMYLGLLTVRPAFQDQGIGKKILKAAENYAAEHNCNTLEMTVISVRHELIAWYTRHGYHDTGKRSPFPNDPLSTQTRTLEFITMEKKL